MFRYAEARCLETFEPKPSILHAQCIEDTNEEKTLGRGLHSMSGCIDNTCYIASMKVKPEILFLFIRLAEGEKYSPPVGFTTLFRLLREKVGYNSHPLWRGERYFPKLYAWPNNPAYDDKHIEYIVENTMFRPPNRGKSYDVLILEPYSILNMTSNAYDLLCEIYDEVADFD